MDALQRFGGIGGWGISGSGITDRLTETSVSYIADSTNGPCYRQTVTRTFHTVGSDDCYTRTTIEALGPVGNQDGLRWITSTSNGTTTVTTTRDSFFGASKSVVSTDDSATTVSPDSVSISSHGREVSRSAYGSENPETMAYDSSGRLIRRTSATGAVTTYTYNGAGQLVATTNHIGQTTTYEYYSSAELAAGLLKKTTNPKGETVITAYNSRGQVVETSGTGTYRVTYGYNGYGEKEQMLTYRSIQTNATGDPTQWSYDPATGLLMTKTDAVGKETNYTYYSSGLVNTRAWARDNPDSTPAGHLTTTYTYNAFGDLTNKDYSDSTSSGYRTPSVSITPDRIGRPSQITDASGTRAFAYQPVIGGTASVSYTGGLLGSCGGIAYTFDDTTLRLTGYSVAGGPASGFGYDAAGRLQTVSANGKSHTYTYIPGTGTYLTLATNNGAVLTRSLYHDRMLRLLGINNSNSGGTLSRHGYTLDEAGRRVHAVRENGQRWDYGYDSVGQVTSAVKKFPGGTAMPGHAFSFDFDGIGNRKTATLGGTGNTATYFFESPISPNSLNQYTKITTDSGRFILGEAPTGNSVIINGDTENPAERAGGLGFFWKHLTEDTSNPPKDNTDGPLWSLDTILSNGVTVSGRTWTPAASVTPSYDFDGNLTCDGRWNYIWDAENRLVRMETTIAAANAGVPRQRLDFAYDHEGRRVCKTVSTSTNGTTWTWANETRFLYDRWNLIAEYGGIQFNDETYLFLQATHTWGLDLSGTLQGAGGVGGLLSSTISDDGFSSSHSYFPAFDGNGNVSAWVNQSGTLIARMDYSPFGQLIAQYKFTQPNDDTLSRLSFGFSTKYTDKETGYLYYIKRYYGPVDGRWLSKDPIGEKGGLNLHGFVGNDGANWTDYNGLLITDFSRVVVGKVTKISFKVPIAFIVMKNCELSPDDKPWLSPADTLRKLMDSAKKKWTGSFPIGSSGRSWEAQFDYVMVERKEGDPLAALLPDDHAAANGYNLVKINCCCDGHTQTSVVVDAPLLVNNSNFHPMNIMTFCPHLSKHFHRTFAHELGHIIGGDDAYTHTGGGDKPLPGWENNVMGDPNSSVVDYRNFDQIFDNSGGGYGLTSFFDQGGWAAGATLNSLDVSDLKITAGIYQNKNPEVPIGLTHQFHGYVGGILM